ncbi:MAG: ATP-binding protein [Elusimicrobiota bacterium]|nr:ATP-binding protein [Elusimicrobiota bacterium]
MEQETLVKVLIVEDNLFDAKAVAELFRNISHDGFALTFAETLEKAKDAHEKERADLILLDLNLPDSFGPQTLTRAVKLFGDQPIVVMTGFYEERLGVELIKKGAQDYLVKGKISADWLAYSIKYSIERAKIERELRKRESRLRDILEEIPDGFLVVSQDRAVIFANHGAELIYGRDRADLMSHPFTLDTDTEKPVETDLLRLDGKKMPLEVRTVETHWDSAACRLVMLRDLTSVRTLERNRDEFISKVSHELRSPLTVVKESLALVYDGAAGNVSAQQKEILKMGLDNTARLNRLIDAMLDLTKIEAGVMPVDMAKADLGALISVTAAEYTYLAAAQKITMSSELPDSPLSAYCDVEKLREVLANLVSNAIKFTPPGGYIQLSLRPWEGQALLCVENSGPGIEPQNIPLLFNKFTQVGRASPQGVKGTGLGLAISRGIVEMHRGRIWAESEPGKYCKFYVLLPLPSFEEVIKRLVHGEIELCGGGKRQLCSVTLILPPEMLKDGTGENSLAAKTEALIKTSLHNSHAILKREEGDFTILLSNSGLKECARTGAFLEKSLADLAGLPQGKAFNFIYALSYPEDFQDEDGFIKKMEETREMLNSNYSG